MKSAASTLRHNPWLAHTVRIERIVPETPGVATYDLYFEDNIMGREFSYRPGQFNMIYLPGQGEAAISISGSTTGEPESASTGIAHTIREAGIVTQALADLPTGSTIGLRGPFGSCWPIRDCEGKDIILVAGGIGLAPLRPVIYEILAHRHRYGTVNLLYGSRMPSGLLYTTEYEAWQKAGITVETTVDRANDDWTGSVGVVTVLLDRLPLQSPQDTVLMTCGPEVMMWYTIQSALARGLRPSSVYVSLERNMNCAIGLCGHCQFGPQFICKDGPVFQFDQVASILRMDDL